MRLWPFQRGIADAMSDPMVERVTIVKPVRVGFTMLLTAAIASFIENEPSAILVVLPTEDDCRDYMVSDIEPIFEATPSLSHLLIGDADERGRNTLLNRRFPGGFLKLKAAKSPRNLRRHTVKVLLLDEVDGMEITREGSPITLAEKRTLSYPDRKIIIGSTPVDEETSLVLRQYEFSDQRVFEVPCPECGTFSEMLWEHMRWEPGRPETAEWCCPSCGSLIAERFKNQMVHDAARGGGQGWRSTAPEANEGRERIHAGFRLNALVSLMPNARWGQLAAEWEQAQGAPETEQVFVNTIQGKGWRGPGSDLDAAAIAARADENIGLAGVTDDGGLRMPADVVLLTAGADIGRDRIEITILGHGRSTVRADVADPRVKRITERLWSLNHFVISGAPTDDTTWLELDEFLKSRWPHPLGGDIGITAAIIDSGNWTDEVYGFTATRTHRGIVSGKGLSGMKRQVLKASKSDRTGAKFYQVAVDVVKNRLFHRLGTDDQVAFSTDVIEDNADYFAQLAGEKRVVSYAGRQPQIRFKRREHVRVEAWDCLVYATAARYLCDTNLDRYERLLSQPKSERTTSVDAIAALSRKLHHR